MSTAEPMDIMGSTVTIPATTGAQTMELIAIYDNGGETFDRYTFFIDTGAPREQIAVFGASEHPSHPLGFGQFCSDGWTRGDVQGFAAESGDTEITREDLPENARDYLDRLLTPED